MKSTLHISILTVALALVAIPVFANAAAWDSPERTRESVSRTGGDAHDTSSRGSREHGESNQGEDNDAGTVLNVSYDDNSGGLVIEFSSNDGNGTAHINVTINGETVTDTGGHQNSNSNTEEDGADGADGADGRDVSENEDGQETGNDTEDTTSGRGADRERDSRATEDRRSSR